MKYSSIGRAILIALLFIITSAILASDRREGLAGRSPIELNQQGTTAAENKLPGSSMAEPAVFTIQDLAPNQNKDKLSIFFAIGLVINIILMSLFVVWAVRQWRRSDKRGHAEQ